jgi:ADP-ribose pyrophosphatase
VAEKKPDKKILKPWKILSSSKVFETPPWVRIFVDKVKLPSGRVVDDYFRVKLPEYAMVYARREDGKVLLLRQYRHAVREVVLTFPVGSLKAGESAINAARRECLEETGYRADVWSSAGAFWVDGNKECGKVHYFIAEELHQVAEPTTDETEESEVIFATTDEVIEAINQGALPELATMALIAITANGKIKKRKV